MDTFNVNEVTMQMLSQTAQSDDATRISNKHLHTACGLIVSHFSNQGTLDISVAMLDDFIAAEWLQRESGVITEWKWRLIRRGSELIKQYLVTGSVKMPITARWVSEHRKSYSSIKKYAPTPEQLADPHNIFALVYKVKQVASEMGLARSEVKGTYFAHGLNVILQKHNVLDLEHYSETLVAEMVAEIRTEYENDKVSRNTYQNLRKASVFLSEMYHSGTISLSVLPNWNHRKLTAEFEELLQHFYDNENKIGRFAKSTINTAKSAVRMFCFELESRSIESFAEVTLATISETITHTSKNYAGGLSCFVFSIKIFLMHLYEYNLIPIDLSVAVPEFVAPRKIFREGFNVDEIKSLLKMPNLETGIGKRDYAIMLLAANTGLRICDISNLKRSDIDWRTKEIRIVQEKTDKPLALPLKPSVGNAIAEYLLNGRPECSLPFIFLCHGGGAPKPIKNRSASAIITRYLRRSEIISDIPRRGAHSFRRGFGTRLLQNEIPIELLMQLLGHSHIDSSKPYLSVDEQGLKGCAISLNLYERTGELV